jgi:uncharacterized NAD(P)/FAD-binding protein YdhS
MVTARPEGVKTACRVAIVGGGFSGAMLSVELLRRTTGQTSIVLIEKARVPGLGAAYSTAFEGHLLNVRAKGMSAYADTPDHFVRWAQQNYSSSVRPDDFLPRMVYGQYIASQLREASRFRDDDFRCIQDEALSFTENDGEIEIRLASGQTINVDRVVLALGNFPPADLSRPGKPAGSSYFISNPWSPGSLSGIKQHESVLLIGSGLTGVDAVLDLRARRVQGTIHMLSRRGLLPRSHAQIACAPCRVQSFPRTARGLLRMVRLLVEAAKSRGSDWREVIDSLRPHTQQIWKSLPLTEQRRFMRHLRTYWDVHRHRIAERIADQMAAQMRDGQLELHTGRIMDYREIEGGVEITYRERNTRELKKFQVNHVVNCTGPDGDFRRVNSPFLVDLLEKEAVRPDEHSLGLDVAEDGAVINARGIPSERLFALGPLRKGKVWESIAVPELRVQTAELAKLLVERNCVEESYRQFPHDEVETVRC